MPELPEVETIRKYLKKIVNQRIKTIQVIDKKAIYGNFRSILNKKILDVKRYGKILILVLENNWFVLFHLKMTGGLFLIDSPKLQHKRVVFNLSSGKLIFNDSRKFGWVKIVNSLDYFNLGIDALNLKFKDFYSYISSTSKPIKLALINQEKIAGIGNIYANEILFQARINPLKRANQLSFSEIKNLYRAIKKILKKAIILEGTSFKSYLKPDFSLGRYQKNFLVYNREELPCLNCRTKIKKIILGGRSTFYCPQCQKL